MYLSMLTIAALSLSTGFAQPGTEDFVHLETLWNTAHRTADAEALDRLWASDLEVDVPGMAPVATRWRFVRIEFAPAFKG